MDGEREILFEGELLTTSLPHVEVEKERNIGDMGRCGQVIVQCAIEAINV
jgi:hypothetical protein